MEFSSLGFEMLFQEKRLLGMLIKAHLGSNPVAVLVATEQLHMKPFSLVVMASPKPTLNDK